MTKTKRIAINNIFFPRFQNTTKYYTVIDLSVVHIRRLGVHSEPQSKLILKLAIMAVPTIPQNMDFWCFRSSSRFSFPTQGDEKPYSYKTCRNRALHNLTQPKISFQNIFYHKTFLLIFIQQPLNFYRFYFFFNFFLLSLG